MKVGIVGAGEGGTSLLKTFAGTSSVEIVGIADLNSQAPGILLAEKLGIRTCSDFHDLLNKPGQKLIIDASGSDKVCDELGEYNGQKGITVVASDAALLLWAVVDEREKLNQHLADESTGLLSFIQNGIAQLEKLNAENSGALQEIVQQIRQLDQIALNNRSLLNEINNVTKIIRNVADQTKMLGINAAIEAARAGDQGRGFSVVADSIRELADNSKSSSAKIVEALNEMERGIQETAQQVSGLTDAVQTLEAYQSSLTEALHGSFNDMASTALGLQRLVSQVETE